MLRVVLLVPNARALAVGDMECSIPNVGCAAVTERCNVQHARAQVRENNWVSVVFYCEKCLYLPVGNNNLG
jgi:hypothetical protein